MDIRTSLIVATRNRREIIRRALPMWKALKGPKDELIVVDGGSDDGTYEVLKAAPAGLIDVLIHEKDRSEAHATNKGLLKARGVLVKGVSDDDVFFKEALERAYAEMFKHPDIDILVTGGESIDTVRDPQNQRPHHFQWYPDHLDLKSEHEFVTMNGLGMIIRRSSLAVTGLYDPRHLHADTSFLTQATVRGAHIRYLRVKGYRHLVGPQSLSLHNVRKTYIYKDHNFSGLSRWRYMKKPREAARWLLRRLGLLPAVPKAEPVWDGRLL